MEEVSLYKISLERVSFLLMRETWKRCLVNPFSNLPNKIVDDVMELLKDEPLVLARPLLTSGSLTRLQLSNSHLQSESDLIQEVIRTNYCKNLRFLTCNSNNDDHIPLIETLIHSCERLEEFHSRVCIKIDIFKKFKELRVLSMNPEGHPLFPVLSDLHPSVAASFKKLRVVSYTNMMDSEAIANVLKHCPQLISIGYNDTLKSLEKIHTNIMRKSEIDYTEVPDQFQLRRCVWEKYNCKLRFRTNDDIILYQSSFPGKIRIAVSLCPFVEELVIRVSHADSIEYLKNLKRLACLKISFRECDNDCMPRFTALLKIIGPNLKYLNVDSNHPVPVDVGWGCWPKLESFTAVNLTIADRSVQPHYNVFLKRLDITKSDQKALLFLFASCKGLVELSICDSLCLNDGLLGHILRLNPLAHLKLCKITQCRLTQVGFRMILENVVSLKRVRFHKDQVHIWWEATTLINDMNLTNVVYDFHLELSDNFGHNF